jgi:hypothetical protein
MPLKESGGRRQHGADHECHYDREKERLGGIENGDHADSQERHQRERDYLCASDDRGQFALAVRHRRANAFFGGRTVIGKDTQLALPGAEANATKAAQPSLANRPL